MTVIFNYYAGLNSAVHVVMDKCADDIKELYRERLINRENQWPPCYSDKLIRLELVQGTGREGYFAKHQRGRDDSVQRTFII